MNDEIKEILDILKTAYDLYDINLIYKQVNALYDYITNLQKENESLKFWLNDVIFDDNNNDVELPARYLRKLGYIDFDEKKQVYTNKHNKEPFLQKEYKEKVFSLKDDELDDYTKQLEYKFKKAIEYIKEHKDKYYHDWEEYDGSYDTYLDELSNILNGGDEE